MIFGSQHFENFVGELRLMALTQGMESIVQENENASESKINQEILQAEYKLR